MNKIMQTDNLKSYVAPEIEVIDVAIEAGFANSTEPENPTFNDPLPW